MNERNRDASTGRFIKTDPVPALQRFVSFIEEDEKHGCWIWTGGTKSQMGYGAFGVTHGNVVSAHRWAYEQFRGPIPAGLDLDHLCRNPICVHPWHLEPVTRAENLGRGRNHFREKTHCPQGHLMPVKTF
jgi:HNH endonuclease